MTRLKQWLPWAIGLMLFLAIGVAALPGLLLRSPLRRWITNDLLAREGIEADIGDVRTGWFQSTSVRHASLGPLGKPRLLEVDEVQSDRTLLSAIFQGVDVGDLFIIHPRINIWIDQQGSNLAFGRRPEPAETAPAEIVGDVPVRTLNLRVSNAEVWLKSATMTDAAAVLQGVDLRGALQRDAEGRSLQLEPGRILDHAAVSRELCDGLLRFVVPILAEATWVKGEVSVDLETCYVHLDEPDKSLISGKLHIHGIEAGVKNELVAKASDQITTMLGKQSIETVHLADNSSISFEIREGVVWHEGVEIGLPRVSPDLVVRTAGTVSFEDELDMTIDVPVPLHLVANGAFAQALTGKSLRLHAGGTLQEPNIVLADESVLADLLSTVGARLAAEDQPLRELFKGLRDARNGNEPQEGEAETPILEGMRNRLRERNGLFQRLRRRRSAEDVPAAEPGRGNL